MKINILLIVACMINVVFFATVSYAVMPKFYFDEYGQLKDGGNQAQQECFRRGNYYWDGRDCRKIVPVKTCEARGGEWHQVQMPVRRYFKNICLCPQNKFWNGSDCVSNLPSDKKCRVKVWCDRKMSDVIANVTPESIDLRECPR